jgi:hypothetical protein
MRKATIFDCPCGKDHVLVFEEVPNPYHTYQYMCPVLKRKRAVNGFQISEECENRGYRELLAKKLNI